jgi:hypothetical protein
LQPALFNVRHTLNTGLSFKGNNKPLASAAFLRTKWHSEST